MDWVLVFTLLVPLLPGAVIGLLVRFWAHDDRGAFLGELGWIVALATVTAFAWGLGYALWAGIWMFLGAQLATAISPLRTPAQ